MAKKNTHACTISIFFLKKDENFRTNARICLQLLTLANGNGDRYSRYALHKESYTTQPSESLILKLKESFNK